MSEPTTQTARKFEYRAQMQQLLHLIIHSLYTHREVFLRELISNATDALNKVRFQQLSDSSLGDESYRIKITLDSDAKTLSIEDTGIGMTEEDLIERIGTIASSGTLDFLDEVQKSDKPIDGNLIGQFGVGFYASFMIADSVVVETRHAAPDSVALRWHSEGTGSYTIEPSERTARGTQITLHLKEDASEYCEAYRVRQVIRQYSNFVEFPIFLDGDQVNTVKALWRRSKDKVTDDDRKEFYRFITSDYTDPLGHLHLHIEGIVNFDALLFIPAAEQQGMYQGDDQETVQLYSSGVFIQNNARALLPEYLRFVRGVVDTDDLPLNVSREVTQKSPVAGKIRTTLTNKILALLEEWSKEDGDRYERFFRQFGSQFKMGLPTETGRRDQYLKLLRYASTKTEIGKTTSLEDYVARMPEDQENIYYLLADNIEGAVHSPYLEYFRKREIEVLLLAEAVDVFTVTHLSEFDGKPLKNIEQAELEELGGKEEEDTLSREAKDGLLTLFRVRLGDRVQDVKDSKRLVDSAAALVGASDSMDTQTERMMRMINKDFEPPKKVLEINTTHALMKNLWSLHQAGGREDLLDTIIEQVYDGALLVGGFLEHAADFSQRMTQIMVEATQHK